MVILHIASITDNPFNGVCVAVPKHVMTQSQFANVGFINVAGTSIPDINNQIIIDGKFDLKKLPSPFSNPDLVIFHEVYKPDYLKIYPELLKNSVPYIIVPHGSLRDMAQKKKWLKKKIGNLLLFNKFIGNAIALQCLSDQEKKSTKFGKQKIVGFNGMSIPTIHKESFNQGSTDFLYIGRLEMITKGLDILVEAIDKDKEFLMDNNCHFSIYGPDCAGRYDALYELIEKHNLQDLISLNHEISGKEKEDRYLQSDIFIQTSRHEGMPMGILEALSYGIPCLITEGTCLTGIVEAYDAGWTSKTEVEDLANAIKKVVIEKECIYGKSNNAILLIRENFDWEIISKNTIELYKKLLCEEHT